MSMPSAGTATPHGFGDSEKSAVTARSARSALVDSVRKMQLNKPRMVYPTPPTMKSAFFFNGLSSVAMARGPARLARTPPAPLARRGPRLLRLARTNPGI